MTKAITRRFFNNPLSLLFTIFTQMNIIQKFFLNLQLNLGPSLCLRNTTSKMVFRHIIDLLQINLISWKIFSLFLFIDTYFLKVDGSNKRLETCVAKIQEHLVHKLPCGILKHLNLNICYDCWASKICRSLPSVFQLCCCWTCWF